MLSSSTSPFSCINNWNFRFQRTLSKCHFFFVRVSSCNLDSAEFLERVQIWSWTLAITSSKYLSRPYIYQHWGSYSLIKYAGLLMASSTCEKRLQEIHLVFSNWIIFDSSLPVHRWQTIDARISHWFASPSVQFHRLLIYKPCILSTYHLSWLPGHLHQRLIISSM